MRHTDEVRRQIEKMIPRTLERGVSPAEQNAAANRIGRLIQRHPELMAATPPKPKPKPTGRCRVVALQHDGVLRLTERAVLIRFGARTVWLPLKCLRGTFTDGWANVVEWLARERELL